MEPGLGRGPETVISDRCCAALPCTPPHTPHSPRGSGPFRPQAWVVLAPAVPRGQWEAGPWLLQGPRVAWPGSYSGHSSHQSLSQQPSSPGPEPASWDESTQNWAAEKPASLRPQAGLSVFSPGGEPTRLSQPRSPRRRGQPTCAVLVKEARLLRHQRAEEAVPEANVQSGKYEGKNAAPNTCGK